MLRGKLSVELGLPMRDTLPLLDKIHFPAIRRGKLETLQVNVGYRCNQSCVHCHVNAGPHRTEEMTGDIVALVLDFLRRKQVGTLDITGGAPELNPTEGVWGQVRESTASTAPHNSTELQTNVVGGIARTRRSPSRLWACILGSDLPW